MDAGQSALSSLWILQYTYGDSGVPLFPKSSAPERKSMFDLQSARTLPKPLHCCKNVASGSTVTHSSQKPTLSCIFPAIFLFYNASRGCSAKTFIYIWNTAMGNQFMSLQAPWNFHYPDRLAKGEVQVFGWEQGILLLFF